MSENITLRASGRTWCACRDCMDLTPVSDMTKPELCELCSEAGCEPHTLSDGKGLGSDCQRDDAYGEA